MSRSEGPTAVDFASLCLYYDYLRFIHRRFIDASVVGAGTILCFSTKGALLQPNDSLFRRPSGTAAILWIFSTAAFAVPSFAVAEDIHAAKPQIQGGNVRVEFDRHMRSRVVARFDKKETVMGPSPHLKQ